MSALRIILFLVLFVDLSFANCLIELRREESARSLQAASRFQKSMTTLFLEQKEGPFLANGTLVELSSGERVLTLTDYLGAGHDNALLDLQEKSKPHTIKRVLWAGEIEAVADNNGTFSISKANETSGNVFDHITGKKTLALEIKPEVENKVENLAQYIKDAGIGKNFQPENYKAAQPHLFEIGFELKAGETLGHLFENKMNQVAEVTGVIESEAAQGKALVSDDITDAAEMAIYTLPIVKHMQRMYRERGSHFFGDGLSKTIAFLESVERAQKEYLAKGIAIPEDLQKTIQENSKRVSLAAQRVGPAAKSLHRISTQLQLHVPSHFIHLTLP